MSCQNLVDKAAEQLVPIRDGHQACKVRLEGCKSLGKRQRFGKSSVKISILGEYIVIE